MGDSWSMGKWVEGGGGVAPDPDLHGNRTSELHEVASVLKALGRRHVRASWLSVFQFQVESLSAVRGTSWYSQLILSGDPPRLPASVPDPLTGIEFVAARGDPAGSLLVWLDEGLIDCVELAAYDMELIDHYPTAGELRSWGQVVSRIVRRRRVHEHRSAA
jgi:hypothetical protein